jgi:phytoene synthase
MTLAPPGLRADDLEACRKLLAAGSKSFFAASWLLPKRCVDGAMVLYAFCRVADDLVDEAHGGAEAVAALRLRLDRVYGEGAHLLPDPIDRSLAFVVRRHGMPRALFDALIEGFAWDAQGRRYETISEVRAYGARVAGTVGALMTLLMGPRDEETLARACDLGVAMQLTNIARDVGADARIDRVYLPLAWLREAGIDPERLTTSPEPSPALAELTRRLLGEADALYTRSEIGVARLPEDCRASIRAARLVYAAIGGVVAANGYDSVSQRASTSLLRKLVLLARSFFRLPGERPVPPQPALEETRFLVEAVLAEPLALPEYGT